MSASIAFVLIGVVLPTLVQGQYCPRTIKEDNNYCARGCTPFRGCSSGRRECICDGDCGYSCIKRGLTCKHLEPRTLANGKIVVKSQKFNDTAVFTCNPGFLLSGSSVRRCRGMGTWDGEEAKCGKNCVDPGVSNNTLRREPIRNTSETFRLSEVLHYYCNAGYLIEGKDSITCQADGTWDGKTPQCYRVSCPPPKLPANSEVYYPTWFTPSQGAKHNSRIFLKCNPGYMKLGSSQVMTCLNQTWKLPASFECLPKNCGDPGVPANGGKNGLIYNFKSKVTFYCDECYKLIGVTYRVCNADQNWSDEQPSCKKVQTNCKSISNIPNGKTSLTGTKCGSKADFSCDKGYNLIGNSQISCTKYGNWSEKTPNCKIVSCERFAISEVIQANVSGYEYGSTAKFKCKSSDYVMSGENSTLCMENGKWSSKVPECLAPCHVPNENIPQRIYRSGSRAELKCEKGLTVVGTVHERMPLCSNGTWIFERGRIFPHCEKQTDVKKKIIDFIKVQSGKTCDNC